MRRVFSSAISSAASIAALAGDFFLRRFDIVTVVSSVLARGGHGCAASMEGQHIGDEELWSCRGEPRHTNTSHWERADAGDTS